MARPRDETKRKDVANVHPHVPVAMNVNACDPISTADVVFDAFPRCRDGDYLVFVGVDGGGTGTDCLVRIVDAEEKGTLLEDTCAGVVMTSRSRTGAANANSVGFERAFSNVSDAMYEAVGRALARCLAHAGACERGPSSKSRDSDVAWRATSSLFRRGATTLETGVLRSGRDRTRERRGRRYRFRLAGVALGIAGCDSPADRNAWRDAMLLPPSEVPTDGAFAPETLVVENDAVVALARATNGAARGGASLIAGTGVVAFAVSHAGNRARTMGFGPAFDDPGSGHHLGARALAATARALDGRPAARAASSSPRGPDDDHRCLTRRREEASIARAVLTEIGVSVTARTERGDEVDVFDDARRETRDARREAVLRWAYGAGEAPAAAAEWDRVASLAPILIDAHKKRNRVATEIVRECAAALAENVACAIRDARDDAAPPTDEARGAPPPFVVVLAGGLFEDDGGDGYRALVVERLRAILRKTASTETDVRVYEDDVPDACGDVRGPPAGAVAMAVRSFEAWRRSNPDAAVFEAR